MSSVNRTKIQPITAKIKPDRDLAYARFPALGAGCMHMFSRVSRWVHVFAFDSFIAPPVSYRLKY